MLKPVKTDKSKIFFYITLTCAIIIIIFASGLYTGFKKPPLFYFIQSVFRNVKYVASERLTIMHILPKNFLQDSWREGSGVTVNKLPADNTDLILLSGFFDNNNQIRLIRRDGSIVVKWPLLFSEIIKDVSFMDKPPATNWNVDIHGAQIFPDGSILFNFEYAGLVKLDRCGKVQWTLNRQTHHSVELSEDGNFWIPSMRTITDDKNAPPFPFNAPYSINTAMKVSPTGKVLKEIDITNLMLDNGLEPLLTATGEKINKKFFEFWDDETMHLNKIEELSSDIAGDFPMLKAGDLMLSFRKYNLIVIIDPDTLKVKWLNTGPWIRQHDPIFRPGGYISVFNNNMYYSGYSPRQRKENDKDIRHLSNIMLMDIASKKFKIIYGSKPEQEMMTTIRGKHQWTATGGLLITEFDSCRIFETDASGQVIWEYINRYDSEHLAEMTEARVYPADYFTVSDWSCDNK